MEQINNHGKRGLKMNKIWKIDVDTLLLFFKLLEEIEDTNNKLTKHQREILFLEFMKQENIKPIGNTELNKEELIKEYVSHGKKILNIN